MIIIHNKSPKYRKIVDACAGEGHFRPSLHDFEEWLSEHHAYLDAGNHVRFDRDEDATVFMLKIQLTGC